MIFHVKKDGSVPDSEKPVGKREVSGKFTPGVIHDKMDSSARFGQQGYGE